MDNAGASLIVLLFLNDRGLVGSRELAIVRTLLFSTLSSLRTIQGRLLAYQHSPIRQGLDSSMQLKSSSECDCNSEGNLPI